MSWLSRIFGGRGARDEALATIARLIERAAAGAETIAELRERLATAAKAGDMDDVVKHVLGAKQIAELYIKTGEVSKE